MVQCGLMSSNRIGRYEIERELGRGGMAVVYLARDPNVKRLVAIKVLPRQYTFDPQFRARFEREAEIIAALEHAYIVPIYDFGEDGDQPYIVMRFMQGGSLAERIGQGPLPVAAAAKILQRLGIALDEAHAQHIIHRDLKPGNILFDQRGEAFLSDFGVAKMLEASAALTGIGNLMGTPAYMSPEQVHGDVQLDGRSDVYALGVLLFEMLTGQIPYQADTPARQMMKHLLEPIPRILEIRSDLPPPCQAILSRAMAKDRDERFATAREMAMAVTALAGKEAATPLFGLSAIPDILSEEPAEPVSDESAEPPDEPESDTFSHLPKTLPRLPFEPEMVLIPAGEFVLGSNPHQDREAQTGEQPQHRFALSSFYLAKSPVTNAQYTAFVMDTGHIAPEHWRGGYPPDDREEHPVVAIFWHDAVAYCKWLAEVTGKPYRLPSEFEWEKGARGKDGRIYPWGNQWEPGRCNCKETGKGDTTPVTAYPAGASPYGLLDMAGNIMEWTRSLYKNYPNDPAQLWEDAEAGGDIWPVLRGGAFIHPRGEMRCAVRRGASPYRWEYHLGFRVALPPPP